MPDFEGLYEVSSEGRVRNKRGLLLKPRMSNCGYARVALSKKRAYTHISIHRLVLLTFVGCPADNMECRHLDGNRTNNRLSNLQWGTKLENAQDRISHGMQVRGARVAIAKLNDRKVQIVKWILARGVMSQQKIADLFGVAQTKISAIHTGQTWKHVKA
jgi:hypothetical protein